MTPTETQLFHTLLNAAAYLAEGRVHHAHQVIQQAIAEYNASLTVAAPVVAPMSSIEIVGTACDLPTCVQFQNGGGLCSALCGNPACSVPDLSTNYCATVEMSAFNRSIWADARKVWLGDTLLRPGEAPAILSKGYEVKCCNHAAGGTLCTSPCGDPACVVPYPPETAA